VIYLRAALIFLGVCLTFTLFVIWKDFDSKYLTEKILEKSLKKDYKGACELLSLMTKKSSPVEVSLYRYYVEDFFNHKKLKDKHLYDLKEGSKEGLSKEIECEIYLNLSYEAYLQSDLNSFKNYLEKVRKISRQMPYTELLMGVVALWEGDISLAQNYFYSGKTSTYSSEWLSLVFSSRITQTWKECYKGFIHLELEDQLDKSRFEGIYETLSPLVKKLTDLLLAKAYLIEGLQKPVGLEEGYLKMALEHLKKTKGDKNVLFYEKKNTAASICKLISRRIDKGKLKLLKEYVVVAKQWEQQSFTEDLESLFFSWAWEANYTLTKRRLENILDIASLFESLPLSKNSLENFVEKVWVLRDASILHRLELLYNKKEMQNAFIKGSEKFAENVFLQILQNPDNTEKDKLFLWKNWEAMGLKWGSLVEIIDRKLFQFVELTKGEQDSSTFQKSIESLLPLSAQEELQQVLIKKNIVY
jgi:hypothetical protein